MWQSSLGFLYSYEGIPTNPNSVEIITFKRWQIAQSSNVWIYFLVPCIDNCGTSKEYRRNKESKLILTSRAARLFRLLLLIRTCYNCTAALFNGMGLCKYLYSDIMAKSWNSVATGYMAPCIIRKTAGGRSESREKKLNCREPWSCNACWKTSED
jgi:hypothetical protein